MVGDGVLERLCFDDDAGADDGVMGVIIVAAAVVVVEADTDPVAEDDRYVGVLERLAKSSCRSCSLAETCFDERLDGFGECEERNDRCCCSCCS